MFMTKAILKRLSQQLQGHTRAKGQEIQSQDTTWRSNETKVWTKYHQIQKCPSYIMLEDLTMDWKHSCVYEDNNSVTGTSSSTAYFSKLSNLSVDSLGLGHWKLMLTMPHHTCTHHGKQRHTQAFRLHITGVEEV